MLPLSYNRVARLDSKDGHYKVTFPLDTKQQLEREFYIRMNEKLSGGNKSICLESLHSGTFIGWKEVMTLCPPPPQPYLYYMLLCGSDSVRTTPYLTDIKTGLNLDDVTEV